MFPGQRDDGGGLSKLPGAFVLRDDYGETTHNDDISWRVRCDSMLDSHDRA